MIDVLEPLVRPARRDPSRQLKPKTFNSTQESIDCVLPNALESSDRAHLILLENNDAVIKMIDNHCSHHFCTHATIHLRRKHEPPLLRGTCG